MLPFCVLKIWIPSVFPLFYFLERPLSNFLIHYKKTEQKFFRKSSALFFAIKSETAAFKKFWQHENH